jgi:hypothetical protein
MHRFLAIAAACIVASGCGGGGSEARELLPDLDQVQPEAVSVVNKNGRFLLVFVSAVDNLGAGPIVVDARRETTADPMVAAQVIERTDGSEVTRRLQVELRYVRSETHSHWHVLDFERYELRRPDGTSVGRDRKTGFCLGDRYERTSLDLAGKPSKAVWIEECGKGEPDALRVRQGISPGYGDPYVPTLEGQFIDVTGLAFGRYVLVHRVNPDRRLVERDYGNNAASVLIELAGKDNAISVRVLASCPGTERCRKAWKS